MRDLLNDLDKKAPENPITAAQKAMQPEKPKRFYEAVSVAQTGDGGFAVHLDGRAVKTPGKAALTLPTEAAAQAVADEFAGQGERIDIMTMPCYRLVNTALDGVAQAPDAVLEDVLRYVGSDLLCYRADGPDGLVQKQAEHWDEPLDWAQSMCASRFILIEGIMHAPQPRETIAAFRMQLRTIENPVVLAGLHVMTSLTGSAILALGVVHGAWDPQTAWTAAHVDEDWQISQWGEDHEASRMRAAKWRDMEAAARMASLVSE